MKRFRGSRGLRSQIRNFEIVNWTFGDAKSNLISSNFGFEIFGIRLRPISKFSSLVA